jgi:glycine/D-amino acid oxidase-like deaminating enzyme
MRVAVLGGGLQGACVAFELADRGVEVDLYEKGERCVGGASTHNEGKIHLGYVFANDPSLRTARLMVQGALTFAPLLRRWLGHEVDRIPRSQPFHYLVHRKSLLAPAAVEAHLHACCDLAREAGVEARDYFGSDPLVPPEPLSEPAWRDQYDPASTQAVYRTAEIAIDPEALAALVRGRLEADPRIRCRLGSRIVGVQPQSDGVTVEARRDGRTHQTRYDHAVNALWESRLAVDLTAGIRPPRLWLYRVKYLLRIRSRGAAKALPATTMVLGPFGDVVGYGDDQVTMSWYPVGMRGSSAAVVPPDWGPEPDAETAAKLRREIPAHLARIIPGIAALPVDAFHAGQVRGGVIFAWGEGDIDDPGSGLHERHAIGPTSHGHYHSVDGSALRKGGSGADSGVRIN